MCAQQLRGDDPQSSENDEVKEDEESDAEDDALPVICVRKHV